MSGQVFITERNSFTSRFKMTTSKTKYSRSRFGGLGVSETGLTSSGLPNGEEQHKEHQLGSTRHGSSPRWLASSPTSGQSSVRSGHSIYKTASEKRARKVRFYRNGDRFFKGMIYAVSTERFRTIESLLCALTSSVMCSSNAMPNGVRYIFTLDGTPVESLDDFQHGKSYVCSSTDTFRPLDYSNNEDPVWNANLFPHNESNHATAKVRERIRDQHKPNDCEAFSSTMLCHSRPHSARGEKSRAGRTKSTKSEICATERKIYEDYQRSFVNPRLITVVRNGRRPRKAFRILLNKKTAQTFDQVMVDITEVIKLDCGRVNKVYTITGQQVMCLADFFQKETLFLACGHEKITAHDLTLDRQELRQIRAYQPYNGKSKDKTTSRRHQRSPLKCVRDNQKNENSKKESLNVERDIKNVTKDNIDTFIAQLPMPKALTNKYEVGTLIGTGNFAVVMECKEKKTNRKYALKIINKDFCKGKEEMIDNEVRILRCVKHPNIIRLLEDYSSQHQILYIMELVKGGDLFDAISSSTTKYTEQDASDMLYNLASALQYLHALSIVHRDVKPENILIKQHEDGTKSLKLGDFGLATEVREPLYAVCGTPTYVAPEVIAETGILQDLGFKAQGLAAVSSRPPASGFQFSDGKIEEEEKAELDIKLDSNYGLKIDVWSAGVIAYILLCGFPPFSSANEDQDELFDLIMTANYDYPSPYWDDVSATAKNVISAMLEINPDLRLSATQVLEHKWIACDTQCQADLRKNVSQGLSTYFRREPRPQQNYAGIKIMASTALDKASKFFRGRGSQQMSVRGNDV